ncbi:MAG: cation diffusion facilitator family transporter [Clostridiales Family XIII bacterium]|jgi:cation diffusion facilitator family transporter|nr:cation diffusion facilitator family transporter [Clostridiales Family XIII bacterium]
MVEWLIKRFVIGKCGPDEPLRRLRCGRLSGAVGMSFNIALGLVKVFIGIATGSVAVMADAVNNLSDAAASIVTLLGFSLAGKKSDAEHPFGHARYEYMTGVIVSAMVIVVGFELITAAYGKIMNPAALSPGAVSIVLLFIMIFAKLWLYRFNLKLSRLIGSASLKATGIDSRNDAISTAAALGAILLHKAAGVNIDGYVGLAVGVFIIYSGLNMVKETAGPLLGQSPDPKAVREIAELVLGHEGVLGIHDLIVHDYGPGHVFASVHIEVDSLEDIFKSHALVDDIEKRAQEQLRVLLVGHMDPLDTQNPKVKELNAALKEALLRIEGVRGFHDLRVVTGAGHTNVIFDIVVAHKDSERTFERVKKRAQEALAAIDPGYVAVVNCDLDYGARTEA